MVIIKAADCVLYKLLIINVPFYFHNSVERLLQKSLFAIKLSKISLELFFINIF